MKSNVLNIKLILSEQGLKKFKNVPTFKNLLHTNQLDSLRIGTNSIKVNHTVWGSLQRVCGYDSNNMSVQREDTTCVYCGSRNAKKRQFTGGVPASLTSPFCDGCWKEELVDLMD